MKNIKKIFTLILVNLILLSSFAVAEVPTPLSFQGDVTIDGESADLAYMVEGHIDDAQREIITVEEYNAPGLTFDVLLEDVGKLVYFKVNGERVDQSDYTIPAIDSIPLDDPISLDLSVSAPTIVSAITTSETTMTITYSEEIDPLTVDEEDFIVDGDVAVDSVDAGSNVVELTYSAGIFGTAATPNVVYTQGGLTDLAGNSAEDQTFTGTEDGVAPTISSAITGHIPNFGSSTMADKIVVKFSEDLDEVSVVDTDFTVYDSVVTGAEETLNGYVTLTLETAIATDATPLISIVGDGVDDLAGNSITSGSDTPFDGLRPLITIESEPSPTNLDTIPVTITFTEEVWSDETSETIVVFEEANIDVVNGAVEAESLSTEDNIVYTANIIPTADGEVTVSIIAGAVEDLSPNHYGNLATGPFLISYDGTDPEILTIMVDGDAIYKAGDTITIDVDAQETGLTVSAELNVLDSTLSAVILNDDDNDETYSITTSALVEETMNEGDIEVTVTAVDAAGNVDSKTFLVVLDKTAPTYSDLTNNGDVVFINGNIEWTVTANDAVSGIAGYTFREDSSGVEDVSDVSVGDALLTYDIIEGATATVAHAYVCGEFTIEDAAGNSVDTEQSCFTVLNSIPTVPDAGDVTITKKVGDDITAECVGSTDADGDNIVYYYEFANTVDNVAHITFEVDTYTIEVADAHDEISVSCSAHDGIDSSVGSAVIGVVTIENSVPVISTIPTVTFGEDLEGTVTITDYVSDADEDVLTYSTTVAELGNVDVVVVDDVITITSNTADWNGQDVFDFVVKDDFEGITVQEVDVDVTPVNDVPDVADDVKTTDEDTAVEIDVLANDEDVDSVLTIGEIITPASNGFAAIISPLPGEIQKIQYTPNSNFHGVDTFEYKVSDGNALGIGTVTVTVTSVNDVPTIDSDAVITVEEDSHYIYVVDANDEDVEDSTLTYELTTSPEGMNVNEDGVISWIPTNENVGSHDVVLQVSDLSDGVITQSFSIEVTNSNDAPTATVLTEPVEGAEIIINSVTLKWEASNDVDPTSDTITYEVFQGIGDTLESVGTTDQTELTVTDLVEGTYNWYVSASDGTTTTDSATQSYNVVLHTAPSITLSTPVDDSVTVQEGSNLVFHVEVLESDTPGDKPFATTWKVDGVDILIGERSDSNEFFEEFVYTPQAGDRTEPHTVSYEVVDSTGMSDEISWDVEVTALNRAPSVDAIDEIPDATEDEEYTLIVTATDEDLELGDSLTFAIDNEAFTLTQDDGTTATLTFTPTDEDVGPVLVTVTVTDEATAVGSQTFTITVVNVNDEPVAVDDIAETDEDEFVIVDVLANDEDLEDTSLELTQITVQPENGFAAIDMGETNLPDGIQKVRYTPNANFSGEDTLTYEVIDDDGSKSTAVVTITVNAVNDAPVAEDIEAQEVNEDEELVVEVTVEDVDIESGDTIDFSIGNEDITGITITKDSEEEDTATATIRWTPTNDDVGEHEIIVNIEDSEDEDDPKTFTVTVANVNDVPTITEFGPEFDAAIGQTETIQFSVTYEDVDAVNAAEVSAVWTVEWADSILEVEADGTSTITVNGADITETGTYDVDVVVSDGSEDTAEHSWKLRVDNKPVSVGNMFRGTIFSIPEAELGAATGVTIEETTYGKIDFGENVLNLVNVVDINNVVRISKGRIGIDTDRYDAFDIDAGDETPITLTMEGLDLTVAPEEIHYTSVFGDLDRGSVCDDCEIISFNNGDLVISVPGFSEYFIPDVNREPIASAGEGVIVFEDEEVTLFGSGSVDPEGSDLTYAWTQDSGPTVSLSSVTATNPKFTPTEIGDYIFSLIVSDGDLESEEATVTITVVESNFGQLLEIKSVDVKSSGADDELKPGESLTVVVKVRNKDDDINLNDVDLDLWFEDDEGKRLEDVDGDDLGEEEEFDLDNDESDSFTFEFDDITLDVEDGDKYTIHVTVVGEDEDNRTMKYRDEDSSEEIEFVREKHETELFDVSVSPNIVRCSRNINLEASVRNIGKDNSEDVTLTVKSPELGISKSEDFELDDDLDDSDSVGDIDFSFNIGDDIEAGFYPVTIEATYYRGKTETEQVEVEVEDCTRQGSSQQSEIPRVERIPFVPPTTPGTQVSQEPVTISFKDSSTYAVLLISAFIIITGLVIFAFGAMIIMATRRR